MRFLEEDEELNPILSAVNLIDVFLVIIAALLIAIAQNPLNIFSSEKVTVIKNAGEPEMEVIVKDGKEIKQYKSTGEIGSGEGTRAGVAYQMADGSLVYVPENNKKGSAGAGTSQGAGGKSQ
ncbi:DUF2149 domain-containing protein [Microbulbifer thermotolerans]|uniref:DUF2149 domain-containing protein n=1 Tax=Microbulbifer thermotolerans TaxID=252514 RepID=A0A143HLP3_MICTH|nr:DUF2149 domain-containing protein [Microbulbifer thermotolerans]AMX02390.1 hypothetical protein A3224_07170 [Microbulbifer thermotolerans]MCX2801788.1 DUF2149 domain-containing protein [Microbulbifer thermotolerans]MCX2832089.1 DUF2149 domain-containing protein [Microbulbifer thermotolerans]MCX2834401.1 DUF2149 domain-containing protein [Microbulbifer thermotolerans]SFC94143.1 hypothetical protein SAMN05660479_02744 [Microbulbifer thermotolerans]